MRAYTASSEEALRARDLLKDWAGQAFLDEAQYRRMEQDAVCDLRRTNIFLRIVLFLFTLIIVGAAVALFFVLFLPRAASQTSGVFLLFGAAITYGAAELAVSEYRLYRYGIEEALAACSVGFLCLGVQLAFFSGAYSPGAHRFESMVPAIGAIACLWIWHRFGLPYAPLAAMIFAVWLPSYWTSSHASRHAIVAAFFAAGLWITIKVRRRHRYTCLDIEYSLAEALLWLGVYLALNLQLSPVNLFGPGWSASRAADEIARPFYWTTWALIWCWPPLVLARGVRCKDRLVIAAGVLAAILTLITNKPYLGWQRHTWDPMLLGALLIGAALLIRRWLSDGPGGVRCGFTPQRLSGKDKAWMNAGIAAFGLVTPNAITPSPQTREDFRFGGGDSGGGGASSDF